MRSPPVHPQGASPKLVHASGMSCILRRFGLQELVDGATSDACKAVLKKMDAERGRCPSFAMSHEGSSSASAEVVADEFPSRLRSSRGRL